MTAVALDRSQDEPDLRDDAARVLSNRCDTECEPGFDEIRFVLEHEDSRGVRTGVQRWLKSSDQRVFHGITELRELESREKVCDLESHAAVHVFRKHHVEENRIEFAWFESVLRYSRLHGELQIPIRRVCVPETFRNLRFDFVYEYDIQNNPLQRLVGWLGKSYLRDEYIGLKS